MRREIPVFKRCCFCVPLRYGLLVWGHFKMIADAFLIMILSRSMMQQIMMIRVYRTDDDYLSRIIKDMILPVIALAVFVADFVATILFIVGGHKKNVMLIRLFYFFSIAMWIFSLLLSVTSVVLTIQDFMSWEKALLTLSFYFLVIVVQMYFLILLRSEIMKLKDKGELRSVKNAAEAECTMTCEEIIAGGAEREDV